MLKLIICYINVICHGTWCSSILLSCCWWFVVFVHSILELKYPWDLLNLVSTFGWLNITTHPSHWVLIPQVLCIVTFMKVYCSSKLLVWRSMRPVTPKAVTTKSGGLAWFIYYCCSVMSVIDVAQSCCTREESQSRQCCSPYELEHCVYRNCSEGDCSGKIGPHRMASCWYGCQ